MGVFRKFPVATVLTVLGALAAGEQLAEAEGLVHGAVASWVKVGILVLTLALGKKAHDASTPVADPKAADGTPLVRDPGAR